jgi:hypothetical protein
MKAVARNQGNETVVEADGKLLVAARPVSRP